MNTINNNGKTYQIDALYVGACNSLVQLKEIRNGEFIGIDSSGNLYQDSWLIPINAAFPDANLGTAEDAPITLIHGNAYQFTNVEDNIIHGIYDEDENYFKGTCVEWSVSTCTNIKSLMVGGEQ